MTQKFFASVFSYLLLSLPSGAAAQSTDDYLPTVEAAILSGWQHADGHHIAALKISLQDGWKTYWRTPGDGGIPPRFDWSASRNLEVLAPIWPAPKVFQENGLTTLGYADQLLLPIKVSPKRDSKDIVLKGNLDIGVCKDICVPMSLQVNARLTAGQGSIDSAIAVAMTDQPFTAKEAKVSAAACRISPTEDDGIRVVADITMPNAGASEFGVIETNNPHLWVQEATVQRSGQNITLTSDIYHGEGKPFFLERDAIRVTIIGTDYSVDIAGCRAG